MQSEQNNDNATVIDTSEVPMEHSGPTENIMAQDDFSSKKKKGSKTGIILGFILLFLLAAGGVGFGIWAMIDRNAQMEKLESQIATLREQVVKSSEENTIDTHEKQEGNSPEETEKSGSTLVDEVSAWDNFVRNAKNVPMYASFNLGSKNLTAFSHNGELSIVGQNGNEELKMDDVIAVYAVEVGNGSVPYFYAIRGDGSVYRASLLEEELSFVRVGDYTKVVFVTTSGDLYALLVDIDGNVYKAD